MRARQRRSRARWLVAALPLIVVLGVIVTGGPAPITVRTFALEAPNQFTLATLGPSRGVCEGPVRSPSPFDAVSIWGAAATGTADLRITARDAHTRRVLSAGDVRVPQDETEHRARLGRPVGADRWVRVCVNVERGAFSITGSPAVHPGIVMTGKPRGQEFSLLLLSTGHHSLLGSLPLAFSRAALFRPSWVGVWTYWAFAVGLVLALAVIALTLVAAAAADETTRDR